MIWLGFKAVQEVFNGLEYTIFPIEYLPLTLLMIFTLGAFLIDRYHYKYDRKLYQYATSSVGLLFCGFVLFKLIQFKFIDSSTTVLQVSNLPGATNVLKFEFKNNNRFRLEEFDMLGHTVFYGRYEKQQNNLFIWENNYNGHAKKLPVKGVINADTVYWNKFDTMLVRKSQDH